MRALPVAATPALSRRTFVTGLAATGLFGGISWRTGRAQMPAGPATGPAIISGSRFDLGIGYREVNFTGSPRLATVVNGDLPAPTLRWKEGSSVVLRVTNNLAVDTSIHWHGIILPADMDGVPGLSFPGIRPGETFEYRFPVLQSGTYWYHSHSGYQEQTGLIGALIIDPLEPEPFICERDYVVVLSDWSDTAPDDIYATLKRESHYYNTRQRTLGDLMRDVRANGLGATLDDRAMWNRMRMNDSDIADVTGSTYTFLMNGTTPDDNWTGLFNKGERVRLRIINAAAMTIFDVRIPGLQMKVVAADGQYVEPVSVDEFRIGVAETYDVIVEPRDGAYTLFAQALDRSGYARGTLAEQPGLQAAVPALDPPIVLTHADMGMGHAGDHSTGHAAGAAPVDHSTMDHGSHAAAPASDSHAAHQPLGKAGLGSLAPVLHARTEYGYQVDMRVDAPRDQLRNPGIGLANNGRRVLTYADLRSLGKTADPREPGREIQLHLTGNMGRYMWSFDGVSYMNAPPLEMVLQERLRIVLVNDTMMNHPIHLHGMWSDLETGDPDHIPRKHTVLVQPGAKISYLVTPEHPGDWAYHCHMLYHMAGMFRRVRVRGGQPS
jgi:CopA family copper-resistance protein